MQSKTLQRSMEYLRDQGYTVGKVEMPWNRFSKVRQDFCGFADAIAYHLEKNETLAIQACTDDGGVQKHLEKLLALENVRVWVSQPSRRLEIWGWGKRGERGKRKLWTLRIVPITLDTFNQREQQNLTPELSLA